MLAFGGTFATFQRVRSCSLVSSGAADHRYGHRFNSCTRRRNCSSSTIVFKCSIPDSGRLSHRSRQSSALASSKLPVVAALRLGTTRSKNTRRTSPAPFRKLMSTLATMMPSAMSRMSEPSVINASSCRRNARTVGRPYPGEPPASVPVCLPYSPVRKGSSTRLR